MTKNIEDTDFKNFDVQDVIGTSSRSIPNVQSADNEPNEPTIPSATKRTSTKQKKASLEEYKDSYLAVPKISDRKTVFISYALRERIVDLVRKLGYEKSSVSDFVENLVAEHLEQYQEEIDTWKRL